MALNTVHMTVEHIRVERHFVQLHRQTIHKSRKCIASSMDVFNKIDPTRCHKWRQSAKRNLLVLRNVAAIIHDDVKRTVLRTDILEEI